MPGLIEVADKLKPLHADLDKLSLGFDLRRRFNRDGAENDIVKFARVLAKHKEWFVREAGEEAHTRMLKKAIGMMSYDEINKNTAYDKNLIMNLLAVTADVGILKIAMEASSREAFNVYTDSTVHCQGSVLAALVKARVRPLIKSALELTDDVVFVEKMIAIIKNDTKGRARKPDYYHDSEIEWGVALGEKRLSYLRGNPFGFLRAHDFVINSKRPVGSKIKLDQNLPQAYNSTQRQKAGGPLASNRLLPKAGGCANTAKMVEGRVVTDRENSMFVK